MLSQGTVLQGRYRIAAHLGGGGFGDVYRADDTRLNTPVAVEQRQEAASGYALRRLTLGPGRLDSPGRVIPYDTLSLQEIE